MGASERKPKRSAPYQQEFSLLGMIARLSGQWLCSCSDLSSATKDNLYRRQFVNRDDFAFENRLNLWNFQTF